MSELVNEARKYIVPKPIISKVLEQEKTEVEVVSDESGAKTDGSQSPETAGFFVVLFHLVGTNMRNIVSNFKKDMMWLIPLFIVWMILWTIPTMTMMSLPGPIATIIAIAIFLTATYNGFVGKFAYVVVMSRTIIPKIKSIKKNGISGLFAGYGKVIQIVKKSVAINKTLAIKLTLLFAGLGFVASNILTRNNKIDKYLVCLLAAFALFDDLSKGMGNPVVRLFSAACNDIAKLLKKQVTITIGFIYTAIPSFAIGLVLSFIPGMFSQNYDDITGYVAGAICIAGSVVVHFMGVKNAKA